MGTYGLMCVHLVQCGLVPPSLVLIGLIFRRRPILPKIMNFRPKMSKKRQSTDKIEGETKRSKNSIDFEAKVEATKESAVDETAPKATA